MYYSISHMIIIINTPQIKKQERPTRRAGPIEPQSELLTDELQKQSYASVSKHLGEKILGDALGAMHSSMVSEIESIIVFSHHCFHYS